MQPTNILVTGCAGFIGSNLCRSHLQQGQIVVGIDNFDPYYPRLVKEQNLSSFIHHPNFSFREIDLTKKDALNNLPRKFHPDVVIHLAAKVGVRSSLIHAEEYNHTNVFGTDCLLEWMKDHQIRKLVFASSSSVYGQTTQLPFVETSELPPPLSPYAATKIMGEQRNFSHHQKHGLDAINLRFFTVFGPGQRPDLAIHQFLSAMMEEREIFIFGDGRSTRDYTYVDDILAGVEAAVKYILSNENVFENINIGSGRPVSLMEMINILSDVTQSRPKISYLPAQPAELENTFASILKAQNLLGYQPKMDFREGIERFVEWFKKRS